SLEAGAGGDGPGGWGTVALTCAAFVSLKFLTLAHATSALQRAPLQEIAERATPPLLFGLAPCGVYPASGIAARAVRSYFSPGKMAAPFHPYPSRSRLPGRDSAVSFLWHFPYRRRTALASIPLRPSPLASTLPCGVRTFLSPTPANRLRCPCGLENQR